MASVTIVCRFSSSVYGRCYFEPLRLVEVTATVLINMSYIVCYNVRMLSWQGLQLYFNIQVYISKL